MIYIIPIRFYTKRISLRLRTIGIYKPEGIT
nr:MAG TPA: hypothetical protein [Caudoviricetes sp.]